MTAKSFERALLDVTLARQLSNNLPQRILVFTRTCNLQSFQRDVTFQGISKRASFVETLGVFRPWYWGTFYSTISALKKGFSQGNPSS